VGEPEGRSPSDSKERMQKMLAEGFKE
jgi:hypothetical protein